MFKKIVSIMLSVILVFTLVAASGQTAEAATKVKKLKLMLSAEGDGVYYVPKNNTAEYIAFHKGDTGYIFTNVIAKSTKEKPAIKVTCNKPKLVKLKTVILNWDKKRNVVKYTAKKKIKNTTITFTVTTKGANGKTLKKKMKVHFND